MSQSKSKQTNNNLRNGKITPGTAIGILGGGQLARMLALAGGPLGLHIHVLSQNSKDPAAQVTPFWQKGSPSNPSDLKKFFKKVSLVTFESEFMDAALLRKCAREEKVKIYPKPQTMGQIQDRLTQKKLLTKHRLPTADFVSIKNAKDLHKSLELWPGGFVAKKRRFGYDGYGTFFVRNMEDLLNLKPNLKDNCGFIAEELIPFSREVAVMAIRSRNGSTAFFPFVESRQKEARCFWVKGPLLETTAMKKIKKSLHLMLDSINYVGAIGVEFFELDGQLLINELAPRVHNTGHYSQDALFDCQFSGHLKALVGLPMETPQLLGGGFAMVNLIGGKKSSPVMTTTAETALHWYGKNENRPGRKMGHLNSLDKSPEKALNRALSALKLISL